MQAALCVKTVLLKGKVKNAKPNTVFFPLTIGGIVRFFGGKNTVPRET